MQNKETDPSSPEKNDRGPRQAKGCCLLIVYLFVACVVLVFAAIAGIIILDSLRLRERGKEFSLERRVERYKVACRFIWEDCKEYVSKKLSSSSPVETEIIQCPVESPESGPETAPESEPEP